MQSVLRLAYPSQCVSCGDLVNSDHGLCGACWRDTPFISGAVCEGCGAPLLGDSVGEGELCDECIAIARPWVKARAAVLYRDKARMLVLALKHGDRLDLVKPAARWMSAVGRALFEHDIVLVPVPSHPLRLLKRRYNQAALLANQIARTNGLCVMPDALRRTRRTKVQDGMSRDERFANLADAIVPARHAGATLGGRPVLVIDDVMTSGATLAASAEACQRAGAAKVSVLVLARVAKEP